MTAFLGRARELAALRALDQGGGLALAWLSGPGGIGKTTLLREFCRQARAQGKPIAWVSVDRQNPTPSALVAAVAAAFGVTPGAGLASVLAPGCVLVLDALESVGWLEAWLLDELALQPPVGGLLLIGSRTAPSLAWLAPHLASCLVHLPLAFLDNAECEAFLAGSDMDAARRAEIISFSRGHPLALAVLAQSQAQSFSRGALGERPDLLHAILGGVTERSLSPRQRAALEAMAQVPSCHEAMLRRLLDAPDVHDLIQWLQTRPYVSLSSAGLHLHDLVIDVVSAELRWRDPVLASLLTTRAFDFLAEQLTLPASSQWAAESLVWMLQRMPGAGVLSPDHPDLYIDSVRPEDFPRIEALLELVDGPEARALWARLYRPNPAVLAVCRGAAREFKSFWTDLLFPRDNLDALTEDPAMAAIRATLRALGVPPHAVVSVQRWHLDLEAHRSPGATMSRSAERELRAMVTVPGLQLRFFVAPADSPWGPQWEALGYRRSEHGKFVLDGRPGDSWYLDFRAQSPVLFLRTLFSTGVLPALEAARAPALTEPSALDRSEVRAALQALRDPAALARSSLVSLLPPATPAARAEELRALLVAEINALGATTRGLKMRKALTATYLDEPASQEAIAERLQIPFRTYRDHLSRGLDELTARLSARLRKGA